MLGRWNASPSKAPHTPLVLSQLVAEFAMLSPRVAEKRHSNVLAHLSSI